MEWHWHAPSTVKTADTAAGHAFCLSLEGRYSRTKTRGVPLCYLHNKWTQTIPITVKNFNNNNVFLALVISHPFPRQSEKGPFLKQSGQDDFWEQFFTESWFKATNNSTVILNTLQLYCIPFQIRNSQINYTKEGLTKQNNNKIIKEKRENAEINKKRCNVSCRIVK